MTVYEQIRAMVQAGVRPVAVARAVGRTPEYVNSAICNMRRRGALPPPPRAGARALHARIVALAAAGARPRDIAQLVGRTPGYVSTALFNARKRGQLPAASPQQQRLAGWHARNRPAS